MHHLSLEELARLIDEVPSAAEAIHLENCRRCAADLAALREQRVVLEGIPDLEPPPALFGRVQAELANEEFEQRKSTKRGVAEAAAAQRTVGALAVEESRGELSVAAETATSSGGWMRLAAGIALFLLGSAAGAAISGGGNGPGAVLSSGEPVDVEAAAEALATAEAEYLRALSRYAELADDRIAADPLNRLAALEGIVLTTRAALRQAPADPVINNYHLTALGHRDAILRQIETVGADDDDWY